VANNLFISYDLKTPGQRYDKVIARIKELGTVWAKVHYSLFYVSAGLTAKQAAEHVWAVMDANDSLIVIDTSNNNASWYNITDGSADYIVANWNR
jgi:hypothetical protein